jgi:pilus assembly protein CpaE
MALPMGGQQTRQSLIVLNKLGAPGTMTKQQVEAALEAKVDAVIPYLPRVVNPAATMGTPAAASRSGFRTAVRELAREVAAASLTDGPSRRFGWLVRRGTAR